MSKLKHYRFAIIFFMITITAIFISIFYTDLLVLEKYGHLLTERVIWSSDRKEKLVALTFDDGPNALFTPKLLDILSENDVKATFFLIGKNIQNEPEIARRIDSDGHEIGNHTYSHPFLPLVSRKELQKQIKTTNDLIYQTIGAKPKYFRPPMGLFTPSILDIVESNNLKAVVGEVYPRDPYKPGVNKIVERVIRRVTSGSIIILHDGGSWGEFDRSQTVKAVPLIIEKLRAKGYKFGTLSEIIDR